LWRAATTNDVAVAVKIAGGAAVPPSLAAPYLRREYGVLSNLAHPAIVRAHAFVDEPGSAAFVTEYLAGGDLVSVAGEPPRHWAAAMASIVGALAFMHSRGIVHRDLKARNVMFDVTGKARLIDFGSVAVVGSPGGVGGTTPAHRSAHASDVSPADDVYALAVLIHELFEGGLPRAAATAGRRKLVTHASSLAGARLKLLVSRTLEASSRAAIGPLDAFGELLESILTEEAS
jgi:serine/threonine-protein kinase